MQIVVNDTNIFIDLIHADILDQFFELPVEIQTTDLVISEIKEPQQSDIIEQIIKRKVLKVNSFSIKEMEDIYIIQSNNHQLSVYDCSVWYYSKKNRFTLLTGDGLLRTKAFADGVDVKGILWVFDLLVDKNIITPHDAASKLQKIITLGSRLPSNEYNNRINKWASR